MSDYGVLDTGFKRKTLSEILDELNNSFKSAFGDNLNINPQSPDGQIIGNVASDIADIWELSEEVYNAFNPNATKGVSLSNIVALNGITRLPPTSSRVQLTLTGTAGTIIPKGSLVSTSDSNAQFSTEIEITLDGAGNGSVIANAVETGPIEALASTITNIDTPITGWSTVNNLTDATKGTNEESDPDLRARRSKSVARDAQSVIDALFAEVSAIENVTKTVVLENDTNTTDSNGLPPHSFQVVVLGGSNSDIANAIWLKKPAGITSHGTTSEIVNDSQGLPHTINFSRPTEIDIYVTVTLSTFSDYPTNGDDLIKQAIVDYANGDLTTGEEFSLGDDVIYTRLYTPINSVQGHQITDLRLGTSASPTGTSNIIIAVDEISNFVTANIVVNS